MNDRDGDTTRRGCAAWSPPSALGFRTEAVSIPPWLRAGMVCFLTLNIAYPSARAQPAPIQEETVLGQETRRPWLTLNGWEGELQLEYLQTRQEARSSTLREKANQSLWVEALTLSTTGAIVHPNVVDFSASGTLDLRQEEFNSTSTEFANQSSSSNDLNGQYSFRADILRNEMVSYNALAQRIHTSVTRDFGPTFLSTTTVFGAGASIKHKTFPTSFQYTHSESSFDDPAGLQGYQSTYDSFIASSQWIMSPRSVLSGNYIYNTSELKAQQGPLITFESSELTLMHLYTFGKQSDHTLSSNLSYYEQSGDFASERLRIDENLTLRHNRDLRTFYRYSFLQDTRAESENTTHSFEASFRHQLYQSLSTNGSVGYIHEDASGVQTSDEFYARLDLDYTKKVPLGRLGLNFSFGYDLRESTTQGSELTLFNQPFTFTEPAGIIINRQNVNPDSIIIRDAAGGRVFLPGIDYTVVGLADRIQIQRVLGGAIPANSTVLVDYTLATLPSNTQNTTSLGFGGSYAFEETWLKGLQVYANYFIQNQNIDSDTIGGFIPDNVRDLVIGANYTRRPFAFSAEKQWHESELSPYENTRFSASYADAIMTDLFLTLNANYNILYYEDNDNTLKYLNLAASLNYRLGRQWTVLGTVSYRNQQDDLFGDTQGLQEQIQIQWTHRQTEVSFAFSNATVESDDSDTSYQALQFFIRRKF